MKKPRNLTHCVCLAFSLFAGLALAKDADKTSLESAAVQFFEVGQTRLQFKIDETSTGLPRIKDDSVILLRSRGNPILSGRVQQTQKDRYSLSKAKFLSGKTFSDLDLSKTYQIFFRRSSLGIEDSDESRAKLAEPSTPKRSLASYRVQSNRVRKPFFTDAAVGGADPLGGFFGVLLGYSLTDMVAFNIGGGRSSEEEATLTSASAGFRFFVPGWNFTPFAGVTYSYVFSDSVGSVNGSNTTVPPPETGSRVGQSSATESTTTSRRNTIHYLSIPIGVDWQTRPGLRFSLSSSLAKVLKASDGVSGIQGLSGVSIHIGYSFGKSSRY